VRTCKTEVSGYEGIKYLYFMKGAGETKFNAVSDVSKAPYVVGWSPEKI
jgi:hypothetical protein